jgi:flagellar hook assembly protein FlgD
MDQEMLSMADVSFVPKEYRLYDAYPNPFNPTTILRYDLPQNSMVTITIYDMLGRAINTIVNEVQEAGHQSIIWDGTNSSDNRVSSGVYIYQMEAGNFHSIKQMILLK